MNTVNKGVVYWETLQDSFPLTVSLAQESHRNCLSTARISTQACSVLGFPLAPVAEVKPQLEEKEGKTFDVFTAVEFKTQVVAGTNYFIKVHVGNDEFMHLRVFKSLPHENKPLSLHSYQSSKTKHDELAFF
nr:cystatin-B [Columba livia]